jgi:protein SCO1/2
MLRLIRLAATSLLVIVLIGWGLAWFAARDPDGLAGRLLARASSAIGLQADTGAASIGGPFQLVDPAGKTVSDQDFRGHWMLVYFGYTFCPDVCPTELQTISAALDQLGPAGAAIVPIFITIDPARDTPKAMGQYVKLFDDRLVGLTGSAEQIADVAGRYRVYYAKVTPKGSSSYLMDHSSFIYLVGPDGRFRALIRSGLTADALAQTIEKNIHPSG